MIEGLKNQLQETENAHQESLRIKDDKLMQQCQELDVRKKLIAQLNTQLIQATNQAVVHSPSHRSIISPSPPVSGTPRSNSGRIRNLRKTTSSPQFVMIGHPGSHHGEISSNNGHKATAISMNDQVRRYHSGGSSKSSLDGVKSTTSKRQSIDYREQKMIVYDDQNSDVHVNKTSVLPPIASDGSGRQGSPKKRNSIITNNSSNLKKSSIQNNDVGKVIVNPLAINSTAWDKTIPPQTNSKSSS